MGGRCLSSLSTGAGQEARAQQKQSPLPKTIAAHPLPGPGTPAAGGFPSSLMSHCTKVQLFLPITTPSSAVMSQPPEP